MRKKPPEDNGTALAESVKCKICNEILVLPKKPPILGQDPDQQRMADFATAFYNGVMKHMAQRHKDMQPIAMMWAGMFSEFLILSVFDCKLSEQLQLQYDVKRVQILKLVQRKPDDSFGTSDNITGPEDVRHYYEETELCRSLEEQGFKLATGILGEQSTIIKP
jgi:hypothetical protein